MVRVCKNINWYILIILTDPAGLQLSSIYILLYEISNFIRSFNNIGKSDVYSELFN